MAFGTFVDSAEACRPWIERGAQLMTVASDLEFWLHGLHREMDKLKGPDRSGNGA
jgi:2-keto-3-deoxy-L-rhamnonate aldolase RhmA